MTDARTGLAALRVAAIALGLAVALPGCGGARVDPDAPLRDAQLDAESAAGAAAFRRGQLALSEQLYGRALARARALDEPDQLASAAFNHGAVLLELGDLDRAEAALAEAERAADGGSAGRGPLVRRVSPAPARVLRARVALLAGRAEEADARAQEAINSPMPADASVAAALTAQAWAVRALAALARDDGSAAQAAASRGEAALGAAGGRDTLDPAARGRVDEAWARVHAATGAWAEAAGRFDRATDHYRRARALALMAATLEEAGAAWARAGDAPAAADRWVRAARSWLGQGQPGRAEENLDRAAAQARPAAGPLGAEIDALRRALPARANRESGGAAPGR